LLQRRSKAVDYQRCRDYYFSKPTTVAGVDQSLVNEAKLAYFPNVALRSSVFDSQLIQTQSHYVIAAER